jgi:hypothetical protein
MSTIIRTRYHDTESGESSDERPTTPIFYEDSFLEVHDKDNPHLKTLVITYKPFRYA